MTHRFNVSQLILAVICTILIGALAGYSVQVAVASPVLNGQETCPDGGGWTKIDSDDLSSYPVNGADGYCFKAGSDTSEGCTGGIFNDIPEGGFNQPYCGLSHWSYHMPDGEETPVPTDTPEPPPDAVYWSEEDCDGYEVFRRVGDGPDESMTSGSWSDPYSLESVSGTLNDGHQFTVEEPEECLQFPTPTPTDEPCTENCEPRPTPTSTEPPDGDDEPRLPRTGFLPDTSAPTEWDGRAWKEPDSVNTWYGHAGVGGIAEDWLYLNPGDTFEFYGMEYVVTGWFKVAPESVWVIDGARDMNPFGLTLITCTGYNTQTKEWRYRLVVYAIPTE